MTKQRKLAILVIVLALATAGFAYAERHAIADYLRTVIKAPLPPAVTFEDVQTAPDDGGVPAAGERSETPRAEDGTPPVAKPVPSEPTSPLPATFNLAVPFTVQAPLGNWDKVHEDTCEEAAALMVDGFYDGKKSFGAQEAEDELMKIVEWEKKYFGFFEDTTAAQTGTMAEKYFGYKTTKLIKDPTVEDIKREVFAGHPVIVPANGQQLGNPYFTPPGPIYHMLVIRGWTTGNKFIANDAGTKHGNGYVYDESVIMNAMHDWVQATKSATGAKVVLVIYPNP
jgi:hypothetical protein